MKKFVLLFMVFGFMVSLSAQNQLTSKKNEKRVMDGQETSIAQNLPIPVLNTNAVKEDVNRIEVGTSAHQRPIRREECRLVHYNPELDVISVTMILDPTVYPEADEVGIVGQFYSSDHGQTWEGPVVIADDLSQGPNYYVAGAFYNPEGNTNLDEVYGVMQGTLLPETGNWRFKSYGSSSWAGENLMSYIYEETDPDYSYNGYWNIFGIEQIGDEMRCLNMIPSADWGAFQTAQLNPIVGTFDGSEFNWDYSETIEMDLVQGSDEVMAWIGMWQGMDAGTEIAWSNDGEIGYMWMVGVSNEDPTGYQPVVYITEDGGGTWDYVYLDFLNDEMQDFLYPYIQEIAGGSGLMIPHIFESAGVVNANGDLEMVTAMGSSSSDVINYPDSIGYHWVYPGDLFNITVDGDGIKDIIWMDSLRTENVLQDSEGNYCGSDGWQHRLFATKSPDANQIMYTWTDTRDIDNYDLNVQPDIFGWAKGYHNGMMNTMDGSVCFTEGTLYETFYFYTNGANIAMYDNVSDMFTIPYIQGVSPGEFSSNTVASTDPITISYVTGIEFPNLMVGLNELERINSIAVAQNNPNPFSGTTTIDITSQTVAPVLIEVSNIMGQTVYTMNAGTIHGNMKVQLNASDLESGVYFYTVRIGAESISKKMIVE